MSFDNTVDFVVVFVTVGMLVAGLGSVALGWVVKTYDRMRAGAMSSAGAGDQGTERTNERTNERSPHQIAWDTFLLDRTRRRLIDVMVDSDLTTTDIRALLKGESKTIGDEVDAARIRLGKAAPDHYRTPIAGRPANATYYEQDSELRYEMPPN